MTPVDILRALHRLGYYPKGDPYVVMPLADVDATKAVKSFQRGQGLVADGIAGPKTQARLEAVLATLAKAPAGADQFQPFRGTVYYVADEKEYGGDKTIPLLGADGKPLGPRVSPQCFAAGACEGTLRLADGTLVNVAGGHAPCPPGYQAVLDFVPKNKPAGYFGIVVEPGSGRVVQAATFYIVHDPGDQGYGKVHGIPLHAFRSLATDIGVLTTHDHNPKLFGHGGVIPIGTKVWIAEWAGIVLPDGTHHDGWWTAHDTGGAKFGATVDQFTGSLGLAHQVAIPSRLHLWYEGMKDRIAPGYDLNLNV
jgi:peptidoglycan hydrolase-like protein with peptidoglycan-binding domain/3D (Asp-Asp-Asp) domain-containing protein